MKFSADSQIEFDEKIIMSAIRAIEQAVTEDVPRELRERHLETNNYIPFIRGDYINQNLRKFAEAEGGPKGLTASALYISLNPFITLHFITLL